MIDYTNNKMIFKRLISNLESNLFPRMAKRDKYLSELLADNQPPALVAEKQLNDEMREYINLLGNYIISLEEANEQLLNLDVNKTENYYIKVLENELLHDFRQRNNITK